MSLRQKILDMLEDEGPTYPYAIYRRLRDSGHKVRYATVRWKILFLKREGLVRSIPPGEARDLGLQVIPNRSGRSGVRPRFARRYYALV